MAAALSVPELVDLGGEPQSVLDLYGPEVKNSGSYAHSALMARRLVERGVRVVEAGWGDLIAFGRPFIANPDLPERIAHSWPFNPVDPATMYGGTDKGYTDYPAYQD